MILLKEVGLNLLNKEK